MLLSMDSYVRILYQYKCSRMGWAALVPIPLLIGTITFATAAPYIANSSTNMI